MRHARATHILDGMTRPVALLAALITVLHADPTPAALNKCAAAKRLCVAKEMAALLGCYAKAAKPPGLEAGKLDACLQKVQKKFGGGATPTKGCFAKLEAIDPRGTHATKMVADCAHLSVPDGAITTGTLPLQYVAP